MDSLTQTRREGIYSLIHCDQSVEVGGNTSSNVIPAPLILLDSFMSREEHGLGRKQATRCPPQEQGEVYDTTSADPAALSAMELVRTIA